MQQHETAGGLQQWVPWDVLPGNRLCHPGGSPRAPASRLWVQAQCPRVGPAGPTGLGPLPGQRIGTWAQSLAASSDPTPPGSLAVCPGASVSPGPHWRGRNSPAGLGVLSATSWEPVRCDGRRTHRGRHGPGMGREGAGLPPAPSSWPLSIRTPVTASSPLP